MLFTPLEINGKLAVRNRIVLAPLWLALDGRSEEFCAFYVRRARGGVGLVIAPQSSPGGLDDWEDPQFGEAYAPLISACHEAGAMIALQVFSGSGDVNALSEMALASLPARCARAAAGARDAGFDAVDIHGAHHSLFMRLLSPFQNRRQDQYGGAPENRWRTQIRAVEAVRRATGPSFPILYRFSAADFADGGVDLDLTVPFAQALEAAGVDCLDVSAGTSDSPEFSSFPNVRQPDGMFAPLAGAIRKAVSVPIIAVGKIGTREVAERILSAGQADLVALGRPLIADPDWPVKLAEGRDDDIVPCLWDNKGCLRDSIFSDSPIRCVQNPHAGHEASPSPAS
jgi:2,4-dienoyl-CoA reductase-like NADH-dependent reductase (Old Yellow Enzyme family)